MQIRRKLLAILFLILVFFSLSCASMYYRDAPVSDPIMVANDTRDSDLCRVEDGGLAGSAGECPT